MIYGLLIVLIHLSRAVLTYRVKLNCSKRTYPLYNSDLTIHDENSENGENSPDLKLVLSVNPRVRFNSLDR